MPSNAPVIEVPDGLTSTSTIGAPHLDVAELEQRVLAEHDSPALAPPTEAISEDGQDGLTAWHNGAKVVAMWANSSTRNAYASVSNLGWRRISPANDSAFVTIVALLSHAEQTGATVNLNIENNVIVEAYVF